MRAQEHPLIRWAAQAVPDRGRRWDTEGASVVTATALNRRNRVVVAGEADAAQPLVDAALAQRPDHVVLGESSLVAQLRRVMVVAEFGWMDLLPSDPAPAVDTSAVGWLDDTEVAPVLAAANPDSWVQVGEPAVLGWAGVAPVHAEVGGGAPVHPEVGAAAVGALAHCAPDVAFLAGVATLPAHRGQGLSTVVCALLRDHGRRISGTVALMVDASNAPAIAVYRRLGFTYRAVTAARMAP